MLAEIQLIAAFLVMKNLELVWLPCLMKSSYRFIYRLGLSVKVENPSDFYMCGFFIVKDERFGELREVGGCV